MYSHSSRSRVTGPSRAGWLFLATVLLVMAAPCPAEPAGWTEIRSLTELPAPVRKLLGAGTKGLGAFMGIADRDEAYNSTDAVDIKLPMRQFVRGWISVDRIITLARRGGFVTSAEIAVFARQDDSWTQEDVWDQKGSGSDVSLQECLDEFGKRQSARQAHPAG